ncbi:MAG: formyltetrahydrofolate deformylase [Deltaproteobacteria bacterium]
MTSLDRRACLLITCRDRPGIVAAATSFLFARGANITDLQQHSTDPDGGTFFMRLEFQLPDPFRWPNELALGFESEVATPFAMTWRIRFFRDARRIAFLVSTEDHALLDLLWGLRRGELAAEPLVVIGNHPDLASAVGWFDVPFEHVPIGPGGMGEAEVRMRALLEGADLVVLARYMRILSGAFVRQFPGRLINIHHSFLPAFLGADPYRQAHERGVKLIGATAHYVVEELDAGPIIEQDVTRVSHRQSVADLKALGRTLERQVLTRAVKLHLEERILVHGNKTVIFG